MERKTASTARAVGLDPYAGFLHEVEYNRPALGLDLLEEFRPVVDGLALWGAGSGALPPQDFTPGGDERPNQSMPVGALRLWRSIEKDCPSYGIPVQILQCPKGH